MKAVKTTLLALSVLALYAGTARAYNYPDIEWRTLETENFIIHYYEGSAKTAHRLAIIAEEQGPKVEAAFNYELKEKTHIVVRDQEFNPNGFAVYSADWITIWSSNLYYRLRGRLDWLRNVFTHEYTHIVSLKAGQGWAEGLSGVLLNGLAAYVGEEDRFSIGYQFVFGGGNEPTWWSEGIAEHVTDGAGDNTYGASRSMLLRTTLLEGRELTADGMSTIIDKWGLGGEQIYNSGYDLNQYIDATYGAGKAMDLAAANARSGSLEWNTAIEDTLGLEWETLYDNWMTDRKAKVARVIEDLGPPVEGSKIVHTWSTEPPEHRDQYERGDDSYSQYFPQMSPDGTLFAFSKGGVVKGWRTDAETLALYDSGDHSVEEIEYVQKGHTHAEWLRHKAEEDSDPKGIAEEAEDGIEETSINYRVIRFTAPDGGEFSFSPDGRHIVYASGDDGRFWKFDGYEYSDIVIGSIDPAEKQYQQDANDEGEIVIGSGDMVEERVTSHLRATSPVWSPVAAEIAFVDTRDGRDRVGVVQAHGAHEIRWILDFHQDAQIGGLRYAPDGQWIVFHMAHDGKQDIWVMRPDGSDLHALTWGPSEERDPQFTPDGNGVLFSADYNGIFNVYRLDLNSGLLTRRTNVRTGAYNPCLTAGGDLLYTHFTSYGFKVYILPHERLDATSIEAPWAGLGWPINPAVVEASYYRDRPDLLPVTSRPYSAWQSLQPVSVVPIVRVDDDFVQLGAELGVDDYLGKHSLFVRGSFGDATNLVAQYSNSSFTPDFYINASHYTFADTFLLDLFDTTGTDPSPPLFRERVRYVQDTAATGMGLQLTDKLYGSVGYYLRRTEIDRDTLGLAAGAGGLTFGNAGRTATIGFSWFEYNGDRSGDSGINPHDGRAITLVGAFTDSQFINSIAGASQDQYSFREIYIGWSEWYPMESLFDFMDGWRNTLELNFTAAAIDRNVSGFDELFAGGELPLIQSRSVESNSQFAGYRRIALSGETMLIANANYRFPVLRDISLKAGYWYFSNLYAQVFGSAGNVWGFRPDGRRERPIGLNSEAVRLSNVGDARQTVPFITTGDTAWGNGNKLLYDAGFEIRLEGAMLNRYTFNSFFRTAWGFQDLDSVFINEEGGTSRVRRYRGDSGPLYYLGIGTGW